MKISNEVKFGILAIIAIVAFIIGVNYMKGSQLFGRTMQLTSKYQDVEGLIRGNPVVMYGVNVGRVTEIELEGRDVIVSLELDEQRDIPIDSKAEIFSADLLGAKAIRIVLGVEASFVEDGGELSGSVDGGIFGQVGETLGGDTMDELMGNIGEITARLASIATRIDTTLDDPKYKKEVDETLENLNSSMAHISSLTGELAKAMPSLTSVAQNLEANNENITGTLTNVRTLSDSLAASGGAVRQLATDAGEAVAAFNSMAQSLQSGEGSLGMLMNDKALYEELTATVQSAQELIEAIKKHPQRYLDVDVYVFERKKKYVAVPKEETN